MIKVICKVKKENIKFFKKDISPGAALCVAVKFVLFILNIALTVKLGRFKRINIFL